MEEDRKIVIYVTGKSCVGKTALIKELVEQVPNAYIASHDWIKRHLAGYESERHKDLLVRLSFDIFKALIKNGLNILLDIRIPDEDQYKKYKDAAAEKGYEMLTIYLEAPLEVCLDRFHERIKEVQKRGRKISVMDDETFIKNYEKEEYVPKDAIRFDASRIASDEMADKVTSKI